MHFEQGRIAVVETVARGRDPVRRYQYATAQFALHGAVAGFVTGWPPDTANAGTEVSELTSTAPQAARVKVCKETS